MNTLTLFACSVFILVVLAAMVVAWLHMQALDRYTNSLPEMKKMVAQLNAAILAATVTVEDFKTGRDSAVTSDASKAAARAARPASRQIPARAGRQSLAALVGSVAEQ